LGSGGVKDPSGNIYRQATSRSAEGQLTGY
jgi:hypothetical protein